MSNNTGIPCDETHHRKFKTICANKGTKMITEMHRIIDEYPTWPVVKTDNEPDEAEGLK